MKDNENEIEVISVTIANSNPCLGSVTAVEGAIVECGEFIQADISNRSNVEIEIHGHAEIDTSNPVLGIVKLPFRKIALSPGEMRTITTEPYNTLVRDGKFLNVAFYKPPAKREPYKAPVLERFEFILQPPFFAAGGDAIRTAVERAPTCHLGCTWNAVTSFILGIILPHRDDNEKLKAAAAVIVPKIIELQMIATSDDPAEFVRTSGMKCFVDETKGKSDVESN